MRSASYIFTRGAEADLDGIYLWSLEHYGRDQTNKFIAELKKAAEFAATHQGKILDRLHLTANTGLSLYPVNNLYLVYRPVAKGCIAIVAIINQSRDVPALIMAEADAFQKDFSEIEQKIKNGEIHFKE